MKTLAVAILNWNGMGLLRECLSSIYQTNPASDVYVIDNGSTDNSIEMVKGSFPPVFVIPLEKNFGFAEGYNKGLERLINRYEFVLLLNNDTLITADFFVKLLSFLRKVSERTGMIALKMIRLDDSRIDTLGITLHRSGAGFNAKSVQEQILCPSGGAAVYSCAMLRDLLQVSGELFDRDFKFYSEDLDLGFRAVLRGWHNVSFYEAPVMHHHAISTKKRGSHFALFNNQRNYFWFIIKNYSGGLLLRNLPSIIFYQVISFTYYTFKGVVFVLLSARFESLKKMKLFLVKRKAIQERKVISFEAVNRVFSRNNLMYLRKNQRT